MELILLIISIVLFIIVGTIGFFYSLIVAMLRGLKDYFLTVAISFDQTGNAVCRHLFNDILRRPGGHKFGNPDETVSQVLGVNTYHYPESKLFRLGRGLVWILNKIDKNHIEKAYRKWAEID